MPSVKPESSIGTVAAIKNNTADFLGELLKDSVHSALINPYNSIVQIGKSTAKEILHTDLKINTTDVLKPTDNATGAKAAGKMIGEMAGTVFDYMVTMKLLGKATGLKAASNAESVAEAKSLLTTKRMTLVAATGFTQGALLTPVRDGESNWTRVAHGGASALSFAAMEAAPYAPGLNKMDNGFKSGLVKSAVAGATAGAVKSEADSLFSTGHLADGKQVLYSTIGGAVGGAAFQGAAKLGGRMIELTAKTSEPISTLPQKAQINHLQDGSLEIATEKEEDDGLAKAMQTGQVHHADGSHTKVVIRALDTQDDAWALMRVQHAQITRNLHIQEGFQGTPPEITVRSGNLNGQVQDLSVQEHSGKSFGGQVREWAAVAKGLDPTKMSRNDLGEQIGSKDIADFISQHPVLHEATAEGMARKIVDGGLDLNLSNWTIPETMTGTANPDGPVHLYDIDPKRQFASHTTPTYGPEIKYGDAPEVVKLFEGKKLSDISKGLQEKFDQLLARYTAPNGLAQMETAGLSKPEAEARLARLQSVAKEGFPHFLGIGIPPEAPVIYMTPEYDAEAATLDLELLAKAKSLTVAGVKK